MAIRQNQLDQVASILSSLILARRVLACKRGLRYFQVKPITRPLMEQPCYKCGQAVEEGIPFCPHCSAPQIRVVVATPAAEEGFSATSPAAPSTAAATPASSVGDLSLPLRRSETLRPCLLAAMVAILLMLLGLNLFVAIVSAGFLSVVLFRLRHGESLIKPSAGARLGALSGLFCFGATAILGALVALIPDARSKMREQIIENIQKVASSRPGDAQVQAALEQMKTPEGLALTLIVAAVFLLVFFVLLGGLGGVLGGAILGRRGQR